MSSAEGQVLIGSCMVQTVDNRGWTTEEIAERALDKLITVSETAHPVIRAQAEAYRAQIRAVLVHYMNEAVACDRATTVAKLASMGNSHLANALF